MSAPLQTVFGWRGITRANLNAAVIALNRLVAKQNSLPTNHFPVLSGNTLSSGPVTAKQCAELLVPELVRMLELQVAPQEANP